MARKPLRRGVAGVAIAALALAGCSSGREQQPPAQAPPKAGDKVQIFYLQKQGTQEYFVGEAKGAKEKAQELGAELTVVDLGNDTSKTLDAVNTAIGQKASGIIIVVPDPSVGPSVVQAAKSAGIPLLTSDDQICTTDPNPEKCPEGQLVPRVGFSGTQMGQEVGAKAAELFKETGWNPGETRIIAAWKQDVTVCTDRVKAALPKFKEAAGADIKVINVGTDNTPPDAQDKVSATVTANKGVKHWVIWGCNDENVTGGVTALENAGFGADDIIGVGINGDLACKAWAAGKSSGVKATLWLNGAEVGALAVQNMHEKVKNNAEFEPEAFAKTNMITPDTYKETDCG